MEIHNKMIEIAIKERDQQHIENATYVTQDIRELNDGQQSQYDLVIAMFLFKYMIFRVERLFLY